MPGSDPDLPDSFLSFVPSLVFVLFALSRLVYFLPRKQRRLLPLSELPAGGVILLLTRIALSACLVGANIAVWVTWEKSDGLKGEWSGWTAAAFDAVAACVTAVLVAVEHTKNNRPSQLAALYLIITALLLGSRLRTVALISPALAPVVPLGLSLAARASLFIALQFSTRSSLVNGDQLPPESTAGLVSRYFVSWTVPLLWRGYRKPLTARDLGAIDQSLHSLSTWNAFSSQWDRQKRRHAAGLTSQPLLWATASSFGLLLAAPVLPFLISSVVTLARPLIVGETITFVESFQAADPSPLADGWGLVGATTLTYIVYALSTALAHVASQRSALAIRGALMEGLYRKALRIRVEKAREMGSAKASNLMSVDVNSVVTNVQALHSVWTALVMSALGLYIIWTQIGISFLASVGAAAFFFAILPVITRNIGKRRTAWAGCTDGRVRFMSSVLRHIKAIKLSAYESSIVSTAIKMRDEEITALRKWVRELLVVSIVTNYVSNFMGLLTVTTFTLVSLYAHAGEGDSTSTIFTVISTISLLADPLRSLGQQIGNIVSAAASWKRIEEFLLSDEQRVSEPDPSSSREDRLESAPGAALVDRAPTTPGIRFTDAAFGIEGKITLVHNVNINLVRPKLWMVVGRVGSGKSTLLQALLGELDLMAGSAHRSLGTVGYCSQDAWLLNVSIRANITFMHAFDPTWYRTVLQALDLETDLTILPDGDLTLTSGLSGGQRQRVALARAVYGRADTYVLDDVFSALDATTEAHVFAALFGPGGLLEGSSTILATNQIYRLTDSSFVTCLENGHVAEQGAFADLILKEHGVVAGLMAEYAAGTTEHGTETVEQTRDALTEPADDAKSEKSKEEAEGATGSVAWSTYALYLRGMGTWHAVIWCSMIFVCGVIEVCINVYLQAWTTSLKPSSPRHVYGAFLGGYAGIQLGFLFAFCVGIFNAYLYAHPIVSRNLHEWQIKGLLSAPLEYFSSRPVGQMVNRFNSDLNMSESPRLIRIAYLLTAVDMQLPNHAVNTMYIAMRILGSVVLLVIAGKYMAAVVAVTAIAMAMLQRFYVRAGRELRRLDLTTKSPIYTLFSETYVHELQFVDTAYGSIDPDGLRTIRAMGAESTCVDMMTSRATASQFPAWLLMAILKWLELALNCCASLVNILLVLIAVVTRNTISPGILAVALSMAAGLTFDLMIFVVEWTNVEMCITSVERVKEYVDIPPQELRPSTGEVWLHHGSIRFSKVSARYKPSLPAALEKITLSIKPGQRVGVCGRSGSGKSTLLGVLWRLIDFDDDGGEIMVDGMDIRDIPMGDYRSAMSIVPQDPLLLELSLRENLDPEGLHSDAELWEALEKSHLKPHVEALQGKLDEHMAGDGGSFSRGQRQLLALARALLRQRRIIALDEATSSIDTETDAAIQHTIRTQFTNATVVTIAHRISTIIDYDVIVVMEQGRIVELGEPDVLLEERGAFWSLAVSGGAIAADAEDGQGSGRQ